MIPAGESGIQLLPVRDEILDAPDTPDHVAYCRGSWDVALCGADTSQEAIVFFADDLCLECLKIATVKYRELGVTLGEQGAEGICFETGRPCPTGEEKEALLQRILLRPE